MPSFNGPFPYLQVTDVRSSSDLLSVLLTYASGSQVISTCSTVSAGGGVNSVPFLKYGYIPSHPQRLPSIVVRRWSAIIKHPINTRTTAEDLRDTSVPCLVTKIWFWLWYIVWPQKRGVEGIRGAIRHTNIWVVVCSSGFDDEYRFCETILLASYTSESVALAYFSCLRSGDWLQQGQWLHPQQ